MKSGYTVLGVDPGLANLGIGVVVEEGSAVRTLHTHLLRTLPDQEPGQRLAAVRDAIRAAIASAAPDALALEDQFFHQQREAAHKVGQAVGVILLVAHEHDVPVHRYGPLAVKQALVGHGRADKEQVAFMVRSICRPGPDAKVHHVSDALALALTHLAHRRLQQRTR